MKILVVTPFMSQHYDAGLFWIKALCKQGNNVLLWDYRTDPKPPMGHKNVDGTIVFKGEGIPPEILPKPRICYWPDALERTPGIEALLLEFDGVFTPVKPTPDWMEWMPSGWDPDIHKDLKISRFNGSIYIGTNNSDYKEAMVHNINPDHIFGNGWEDRPGVGDPAYLRDFVLLANQCSILIDVHQSPNVGLNRKFFELIACGFTIVDDVPGVEEILGHELTRKVSYRTYPEARALISYYLKYPGEIEVLWKQEKEAIEPYTYHNLAWRMVQCLQSVE